MKCWYFGEWALYSIKPVPTKPSVHRYYWWPSVNLVMLSIGYTTVWSVIHECWEIEDKSRSWNNQDLHTPCWLSFQMTLSDLRWLSEILSDTKHCTSSRWQLSFLFDFTWNFTWTCAFHYFSQILRSVLAASKRYFILFLKSKMPNTASNVRLSDLVLV